jgi:hypothetical protein
MYSLQRMSSALRDETKSQLRRRGAALNTFPRTGLSKHPALNYSKVVISVYSQICKSGSLFRRRCFLDTKRRDS